MSFLKPFPRLSIIVRRSLSVNTKGSTEAPSISTVIPTESTSASDRSMVMKSKKHLFTKRRNYLEKSHTKKSTKTVKVFLSLTLLFIISFVPTILGTLIFQEYYFLRYGYFINHFGNPIIYFLLDNVFRSEIYSFLEKVKAKFKCC